MSRGQELYIATIWSSVKNVAVILDFFLQNALQVEEINEKIFALLEQIFLAGSVSPNIHMIAGELPTEDAGTFYLYWDGTNIILLYAGMNFY